MRGSAGSGAEKDGDRPRQESGDRKTGSPSQLRTSQVQSGTEAAEATTNPGDVSAAQSDVRLAPTQGAVSWLMSEQRCTTRDLACGGNTVSMRACHRRRGGRLASSA